MLRWLQRGEGRRLSDKAKEVLGCDLIKHPSYGLVAKGKKRWRAGCGEVEGAVSLNKPKICEGCGLEQPSYGLVAEGKMPLAASSWTAPSL